MRVFKKVCDGILILMVLAVVAIFSMQLLGYRLVVIQTGSMLPVLEVGELCLVREVEDDYDIKKGNIITYNTTDGSTKITHRVVDVTEDGRYVTKGDNNTVTDEGKVKKEQIVGVVSKSFHNLGYPVQFFNSLYGKVVSCIMIVFCFIVGGLKVGKEDKEEVEKGEGTC